MAAELAAGRVGTGRRPAGASGTGSAVNPLVRWGVVGRCGTGRDAAPTAHNPEVEGSNPSPATKLAPPIRRFTSSQRTAGCGCCQSFVSGRPGLRSGPFAWAGTVENQFRHGAGGR